MKKLHIDTPIGGIDDNIEQYECSYCHEIFPKSELESDTEDGLICKDCQEKGDYYANSADWLDGHNGDVKTF